MCSLLMCVPIYPNLFFLGTFFFEFFFLISLKPSVWDALKEKLYLSNSFPKKCEIKKWKTMKNAFYPLFLVIFVFVTAGTVHAQRTANTPNNIYENFSKAYLELDAGILEQLYVKDAVLLNLYDQSNPNSIHGNQTIQNYFSKFFKQVEKNGQTMRLVFKITNREDLGEKILDNGFYELTYFQPDGSETKTHGKLSTILKMEDALWKFMVDANTNTEEVEYRNADTNGVTQPK